ncbi:iron-sulfur cluster assembly protein [Mycolicibacter kumamotonensis]|uniref:Iron-sulfur cluster assembly protein n=1 Tax=Mycolicibacter kumamotonensis TaxID=354243 RepID=A0A7K3LH69_9MYCO|nr:iron-sulfur cluster assembly protein [Mycolicibacter kumamotonensis]NDJ91673.1 iron-sulfur cluster assembly protein [Mycolicibacter kumamotonensis]
MSESTMSLEAQILAVLSTVPTPESDQTIAELGYVRTVTVDDNGVTINLKVPPVSSSESRAYLSAFEIQNALRGVQGIGAVEVVVDDHPDGDTLNADPALLRQVYRAALERCISARVQRDSLAPSAVRRLILRDLPEGRDKTRLLHCRYALGLSMCLNSRLFVDHDGKPLSADEFRMPA